MRAELSRACCGVVGGCGCALPVAHLAVRGSAAALRAGRPAAPGPGCLARRFARASPAPVPAAFRGPSLRTA